MVCEKYYLFTQLFIKFYTEGERGMTKVSKIQKKVYF